MGTMEGEKNKLGGRSLEKVKGRREYLLGGRGLNGDNGRRYLHEAVRGDEARQDKLRGGAARMQRLANGESLLQAAAGDENVAEDGQRQEWWIAGASCERKAPKAKMKAEYAVWHVRNAAGDGAGAARVK
eukprot:scaffold11077_cov78-Cyclotella_meneghiniana.AAC.5